MTIAFVHEDKAFLPELSAYTAFFSARGVDCKVISKSSLASAKFDVRWMFMGTDKSRKDKATIVVHEYASASVPPMADLKDLVKKHFSAKPDYRIYNNQFIKDKYAFTDHIPSGIRDYGITKLRFTDTGIPGKLYDFIYVGTTDNSRDLDKLFECFTQGPMKTHSLLILSKNYEGLAGKLSGYSNISLKGPVAPEAVYNHIRQARYGINYIPDKLPYTQQTAAKLLDYSACGTPVVTSDYAWVREFQKKSGGRFFFLDKALENFTWENISQFSYDFPDLSDWTWEKQIRRSGILNFLKTKFPELPF